MFVVLVGGYSRQREEFFNEVNSSGSDAILWINDRRTFYYIADLFVNFGGQVNIPAGKPSVTWSGDNQETIERIYKTLGLE